MYPQARSIFYRALTQRIPHNVWRLSYGAVSSPICSLCHQDDDTRFHFLVCCPRKWALWEIILRHHYPTTMFTPDLIYRTLQALDIPAGIFDRSRFLTICSTVLWKMWILHWTHGSLNELPLDRNVVTRLIPRVEAAISVILNRHV